MKISTTNKTDFTLLDGNDIIVQCFFKLIYYNQPVLDC